MSAAVWDASDPRNHPAAAQATVQSEADFFCNTVQPVLVELTASLARYQPDRPGAFLRALATGSRTFEGSMRGEETFSAESASQYMALIAGPMLEELAALIMTASPRPANAMEIKDLIAQHIDAISRKMDQASTKISAGLKGYVARRKVTRMRVDPQVQERAAKAKSTSPLYAPGAASRRGGAGGKGSSPNGSVHPEASVESVPMPATVPALEPAPLGASASTPTPTSETPQANTANTEGGADAGMNTHGAGVEAQVRVEESEFQAYVSSKLTEAEAAACKVQALARRRAATKTVQGLKTDPTVRARAQESQAKAADLYSTDPAQGAKARKRAAAAAAAAQPRVSEPDAEAPAPAPAPETAATQSEHVVEAAATSTQEEQQQQEDDVVETAAPADEEPAAEAPPGAE